MPLGMFVNPLPGCRCDKYLCFDFPAQGNVYKAGGTRPNINLLPPAIEQMYGLLGVPPKQQGNPFMAEATPVELEDPSVYPYQDQIVDIDRKVRIYHTGRLSGLWVPFIANGNFESTVRIDAIQNAGAVKVQIYDHTENLIPQPGDPANFWFWRPGGTNELLYTACVEFDPKDVGGGALIAGELYKLNIRWEFRYVGPGGPLRTGISGFDETVAFQVSEQTHP